MEWHKSTYYGILCIFGYIKKIEFLIFKDKKL